MGNLAFLLMSDVTVTFVWMLCLDDTRSSSNHANGSTRRRGIIYSYVVVEICTYVRLLLTGKRFIVFKITFREYILFYKFRAKRLIQLDVLRCLTMC